MLIAVSFVRRVLSPHAPTMRTWPIGEMRQGGSIPRCSWMSFRRRPVPIRARRPGWKFVNVRRLPAYVERSIEHGLQWVLFEPNDERLWARARQQVEEFLTALWREGRLVGTRPQDAFFVKVDRTTMTQDDIDNGRLIVLVGIATAASRRVRHLPHRPLDRASTMTTEPGPHADLDHGRRAAPRPAGAPRAARARRVLARAGALGRELLVAALGPADRHVLPQLHAAPPRLQPQRRARPPARRRRRRPRRGHRAS